MAWLRVSHVIVDLGKRAKKEKDKKEKKMEEMERAFLRREEDAADELLVRLWAEVSARYPDDVSLWHTRTMLSSFRAENAVRLPASERISAKLFFIAWTLGVPECAKRPLIPSFIVENERLTCFVLSLRAYFADTYLQGGEPDVERDLLAVNTALREC